MQYHALQIFYENNILNEPKETERNLAVPRMGLRLLRTRNNYRRIATKEKSNVMRNIQRRWAGLSIRTLEKPRKHASSFTYVKSVTSVFLHSTRKQCKVNLLQWFFIYLITFLHFHYCFIHYLLNHHPLGRNFTTNDRKNAFFRTNFNSSII